MKRWINFILIFSFLFCATILVAQKETYTWPFGYKRMLTFHGGQMQYLDSINEFDLISKIASISDCSGNLLFYSNGVVVKNNLHDTINGGHINQIFGSLSNLLLKNMETDSIYHLFITPSALYQNPFPQEDSTIQEITINRNFNNGKGKVVSKKIRIKNINDFPQFTVISNSNDSSYWLLANYFDGEFHAYPIGDTGLILNPISSNISISYDRNLQLPGIKYSPSGSKVIRHWSNISTAYSIKGNPQSLVYGFNIFDFNRASGQVTFDRYIQLPDLGVENAPGLSPRGLTAFEFSPNERYLYCFYNRYSVLWQIDLSLPPSHPFAYQYISMPQTDPNKLIFGKPLKVEDEQREDMLISPYLSSLYSPFVEDAEMFSSVTDSVFLSEIAAPNNPLSFAGFTYKKLFLGLNFKPYNGYHSTHYLPHFPQGLTKTVIYSSSCAGDTIQFEVSSLVGVDSLHWHFGDSASGSNNTSNSYNPSHAFLTPGAYQITTTVFRSGGCTDSILTQFYAQEQPNFVLPLDTFFCAGDTLNLSAINPPVASYRWLDTLLFGYQRNIFDSGTYILESFNDCGTDRDTFVVYKIPQPNAFLGNDTTICFGDTILLNKYQPYTSFLWHNTFFFPTYAITSSDTLVWLESSNICGVNRDSIYISYHLPQKPNLGNDTAICLQDSLIFQVPIVYDSLVWNTQIRLDTFSSSHGSVVAEMYNACGFFADTIIIDTLIPLPPNPQLPATVSICKGDSVTLSVSDTLSQFLWNTGEITPLIVVDTSGNFRVMVNNICGVDSAESIVELHQPLNINLRPDTGICFGIPYQITVPLAPSEYDSVIWNGWIKSPTVLGLSGQYSAIVYNACGSYFDTTTVNRINPPKAQLPNDTAICQYDTITIKNKIFSKYNHYLWSTGANSDSLAINQPQTYTVTVSNNCGNAVDSIKLFQIEKPIIKLLNDTAVCTGSFVKLFNQIDSTQSLIWNTGDTSNSISIQNKGLYVASLLYTCGLVSDSVKVKFENPLKSPFYSANKLFCQGDTLIFEADTNASYYLWSTGQTQMKVYISEPQILVLTQSNSCGGRSDSIELFNFPIPTKISENYIVCPGNTIEVKVSQPLINVLWNDGTTNNIKQFTDSITTSLLMYNSCGDSLNQRINILQTTIADTLVIDNEKLQSTYLKGSNYRWSLNGSPLLSETNTFILPEESGFYQLFFLDEYGCERSQQAFYEKVEVPNCDNWKIYPNPINDQLNLFLPGELLKSIEIYDITGKIVFNQHFENGVDGYDFFIPIDKPSGVYFIRVALEGCVKTKRFILEKKG